MPPRRSSPNDWPIAAKINVAQSLALAVLFLIAIVGMTVWLTRAEEAKSFAYMRQSTQQVVDMVEAYNTQLEKNAERLGKVLDTYFPAGFTLDEQRSMQIGDKSVPVLHSGGATLNLNFETVDRFTTVTAAVATVFARQGDDFVRVTTSLKKENGERAVGTQLDRAHPAYERLLKGETFRGKARLFGRDYMTYYEPQKDKSGRVVAVLFIGLDFTSELEVLKQKVSSIKFGKSGYVFAVDAGKDKGTLTIHPTKVGTNLYEAKDSRGVAYVKEMVDAKSGELRYHFPLPNAGDSAEHEKIAIFIHLPVWNWVVAATVYTEELSEEVAALRNTLIVSAICLMLALVAVGYFVSRRWVSQPLAQAVGAMQQIASGDLTVHLPSRGNDEVGQLLDATGEMAGKMRTALADIQRAAGQLADSAHQLASSSSQVASQSSLQSDAATAMAASVEELNASIVQVSDSSAQARQVSSSSGQVSDQGAAVIQSAVGSMSRIAETVRGASQVVAVLGQESQAISAIVSTIKEIADQTNLLALNAAIEAARAGEQGRGFAVVADEVRKLAERTTLSTQEIESMIGKILSGTSEAVSSMEAGVQQVEEGVTYAGQAGDSIATIRHSAADVAKAVSDIAMALSEQSLATSEIAGNVEKIAVMADENHRLAHDSAGHAQKLEGLADSLRTRVGHFRI